MNKRILLFWSKTDIAAALNVSPQLMGNYISEDTKKAVNWRKGRQCFKQNEVFAIIRDLNPLWNDEIIDKLIQPFDLNK